MTGSSGYIYDFKVYTAKTGAETDNFGLGVSSGFVMRLTENIPRLQNYKLFYDDWFSSIDLAKSSKMREFITYQLLDQTD